jgi:SAM-dependent methyltransferase
MSRTEPEFDAFADRYDQLLRDPIRDRFVGADSQFFHVRKYDLIRDFYRRYATDTKPLTMLDIGCGRGELLKLLRGNFAEAAGCDLSQEMLESGRVAEAGIDVRLQISPTSIPFEDARFDLVTAVCVYHHVALYDRDALTADVRRVLKPGGVFALIEHNPYNPATRTIVSRTPVDADAVLLRPIAARRLLARAGFSVLEHRYFLYLPKGVYNRWKILESLLRRVPLGGQYAFFGSFRNSLRNRQL